MAIALPAETRGKCAICGMKALLGDGLCRECWDATAPDIQCVSNQGIKIRNVRLKRLYDTGNSLRKISNMAGLDYREVKRIINYMRRIE